MSYRRGPNCLPTGDVEPRAEDLFLRGWDREGGGVETRITMRHASIGSSRERKRFSRRSVLAALWYYLLLGDVEANFTTGKILFFFLSFFFPFLFYDGDLWKSNVLLFKSFFLPSFPIRYDRKSCPTSVLFPSTFSIVKLPLLFLRQIERPSMVKLIKAESVGDRNDTWMMVWDRRRCFFFRGRL